MDGIPREALHPNTGGVVGGTQSPDGEPGVGTSPVLSTDQVIHNQNESAIRSTPAGGVPRTPSLTGRVRGGLKNKASGLPALVADGLQAGAKALRNQRALTPATGRSSSVGAFVNDPALAPVADSLADGLETSADWLRDADLDKVKKSVARQAKEHPVRTLLVAAVTGLILGKAFRRR